jgi:polysaccharide deacetylase family protein (PEP-CTERM system associated)
VAQPLLLSVDFEDWHQLVRRRVGVPDRGRPGPALQRQTDALLGLLDEVGAKATFFILGMAAREHPALLGSIAAAGHEIACHGDQHVPVHSQSPESFAADVRRASATIQELTGVRPLGYRAPAFSITRESAWAYDVLMAEGFTYDSSQHDSPRLRERIREGGSEPHVVELAGGRLWEFPIAVWNSRAGPVPVGGASYWAVLPTRAILHGLGQAGALAGLYLHPQELDPKFLHAELSPGARTGQRARGAYRAAQRNLARWRTAHVLRAIAGRHELIPYGEGHARLATGTPAGAQPVHRQGASVRRPV